MTCIVAASFSSLKYVKRRHSHLMGTAENCRPKLALLLLLVLSTAQAVQLDQPSSYDVLRSLNNSGGSAAVEIHMRLYSSGFHKDALLSPHNASASNFEQNLETLLSAAFGGAADWRETSALLSGLANRTHNATLKLSVYRVLWREIQSTNLRYNPFNIESLLQSLHQAMNNVSPRELLPFARLALEIRSDLTARCAQMLEGALYAAMYHNGSWPASAVLRKLQDVLSSDDGSLFSETLDHLYDAVVEVGESPLRVAQALGNFSFGTQLSILANLKYMNRLGANESVARELLITNLEACTRHADFDKVPLQIRLQVNDFRPPSLRNLYTAEKVCIRNAAISGNNGYLYECPQTYLMCTNARDSKKAAFYAEHKPDQRFSFRSSYWSQRYIKLERGNDASDAGGVVRNISSLPAITKNVYSRSDAGLWRVGSDEGFAVIMDSTSDFYLCAGNRTMWSGFEHHVYTRRALDAQQYRHECHWLIEDCAKVASA